MDETRLLELFDRAEENTQRFAEDLKHRINSPYPARPSARVLRHEVSKVLLKARAEGMDEKLVLDLLHKRFPFTFS